MSVFQLQRALKRRGYDPGPIDGKLGPKTEAAIIAFKTDHGLRARAYVGPITREKLGIRGEDTRQRYRQAWMNEAARHLGEKEIPGKLHNPRIVRWTRELGGWWSDDETPWCGTFVAWCLRASGFEPPRHWYRARAYAEWGAPVTPRVGAIAVFGRKGGGHVGFIVGESASDLYILGGNQGNMVNISPIAKDRLISCRWPYEAVLGERELPRMAGGVRTVNEA